MANRDHSLDRGIIRSAKREFLHKGYEKASLRTIAANADVTVGAIYTRYRTKEELFGSLVQPLADRIMEAFSELRHMYYETSDMEKVMMHEMHMILHILFDHYDESKLLLCRSQGSGYEKFFNMVVEKKIEESIGYFVSLGLPHPDDNIMRLLITSQFEMYHQIIEDGFGLEEARRMMDAAVIYTTGGWSAIFQQYQGRQI